MPDWYPVIQAAKVLGRKPWQVFEETEGGDPYLLADLYQKGRVAKYLGVEIDELDEQPYTWRLWGEWAMEAEAEAREVMENPDRYEVRHSLN